MARGGATEQAAKTTFRDVFAVAEFRALWGAQLLSVMGDQLARVALTVLVYDRTRSALLAAITFVVSIVPAFFGGVTLAWLADRYPRRGVMIACDLARCALVLVMAIPGMSLVVLVTLLFLVTLVGAPFTSARAAIYPDVLEGEKYVMGTAVTLTTYQFALVLGFAAGGAITGFFGTRQSLIIDAATFAVSALIVRTGVRSRPAPAAGGRHERSRLAGVIAGARLVFTRPALRTPMLFGWLAAFYNAPEGVVTPLARDLGGGAAAVGVLLAASALGETIGRNRVQPLRQSADTAARHGSARGCRLRGSRAVPLAARSARLAVDPGRIGSVCFLHDRSQRRLRERSAARTAQPGLRPSPGWNEPGPGNIHDRGGSRRRSLCPGTGNRRMWRCRRRGGAGDRGQLGSRSWPASRRTPAAQLGSAPGVVAHGVLLSGSAGGWWRCGVSPRCCRAQQAPLLECSIKSSE